MNSLYCLPPRLEESFSTQERRAEQRKRGNQLNPSDPDRFCESVEKKTHPFPGPNHISHKNATLI